MASDYYILQLERNNVYLRARFLQPGVKKKNGLIINAYGSRNN